MWNECSLFYVCLVFAIIAESSSFNMSDCDFHDTVNMTGMYENGSYMYQNVKIPAHLIGDYDYEEHFNGEVKKVLRHVRGCICKLKPCIRFCCSPSEQILDGNCEPSKEDVPNYLPYLNVSFESKYKGVQEMHAFETFFVIYGAPCQVLYPLGPEETWKLFENSTVYRNYDETYLTRNEYCFHPASGDNVLLLHNCGIFNEPEQTTPIIMIFSIILMTVTIIVILYARKPTDYQKCLVCYMITLCIGYELIVINVFVKITSMEICVTIGYIGYFAFISAFLWLCVISVDMWNKFRVSNFYTKSKTRFQVYSFFAWGIAFLLTLLTFIADSSYLPLDKNWRPNIGVYNCWIFTQNWTAYIYFYGPIIICIIFNSVMFVLTSKRIYEVKVSVKFGVERVQTSRRINSDQRNFTLFCRIFFLMGVVWILEIVAYTLSEVECSIVYYIVMISDCVNSAQGIMLFLLLINFRYILDRLGRLCPGKTERVVEVIPTQTIDSTRAIFLESHKRILDVKSL